MTNPGEVGEVTGELRFTTDKAQKDIRQGLEKAGRETDDVAATMGARQGSLYGKSFRDKSDEHLNRLGTDLGSALRDIHTNFDFFDFTPDDERRARRKGQGIFSGFVDGIRNAFSKQGGAVSDIFNSVLGGPVGAFFNVSGKSPLLILLVPLLGYIISLITAVVYGLQAAISFIYLIPSLLFAVGLQATALFFIFSGLGEIIGNAFAATNAEELDKALEGVNKQIADVVRNLIPWRDFFKQLKSDTQFAFFDALNSDKILSVLNNIRGPFGQAIVNIGAAFGYLANNLLDVFASPRFAELISVLGQSTVAWLMGLGPALANFIDGLNVLGIAIDGFLDWFGEQFNLTISNWGDMLKELAQDPDFFQWLEDSKVILGDFMELFGSFVTLLIVFVQKFTDADKNIQERFGKGFLDQLSEMTRVFTAFLNTQVGQDALEGVIYLLIGLAGAFYFILIVIFLFIGAFNAFADTLAAFFSWLGTAARAIGQFFSDLGSLAQDTWFAIRLGFYVITEEFGRIFNALGNVVHEKLSDIGEGIDEFFDELPENLYNAGKMLIQRLGDGIKDAMPGLSYILGGVGSLINSFFNHSPAEQGPLSGRGDPLYAGQEFVNRLSAGIEMQSPSLTKAVSGATSNLTFDPGAIQVNYYGGTPPTPAQARGMGAAAGRGIADELTATRLAVRTL